MSELVIALDYPSRTAAVAMAERVAPAVSWVKVGLELYTAEGPDVVRELKDIGLNVFVDLKFFDIPNTVRGAVRSAVHAGADMVNIHTLGGARMAEAAREGVEGAPHGARPLLLGVTVLTSMDAADLDAMGKAGQAVSDLVVQLAGRAKAYYLDGVVCSGLEVGAVKAACGNAFYCLTPGIRSGQAEVDDQRRVVTPRQAALDGSDYLVVGRPVTGAADPVGTAKSMAEQMQMGARERGNKAHG